MYAAQYRPLFEAHAEWASIACLPWDEAIFGFKVADLTWSGKSLPTPDPSSMLRERLACYCADTKALLVSARTDAADGAMQAILAAAGFLPVEFSLMARMPRIRLESLPPSRFPLRAAEPEDHEAIVAIAGSAFAFGRYHGDRRFPRDLANRRYAQWVKNALQGKNRNDRVLVLGRPKAVNGFMNMVIEGGHADLRLAAVDPGCDTGLAGVALYAEALRSACELGARSASAKIAAANTRVLNVCSLLGYRFANPEMIWHWHAPDFDDVTSRFAE